MTQIEITAEMTQQLNDFILAEKGIEPTLEKDKAALKKYFEERFEFEIAYKLKGYAHSLRSLAKEMAEAADLIDEKLASGEKSISPYMGNRATYDGGFKNSFKNLERDLQDIYTFHTECQGATKYFHASHGDEILAKGTADALLVKFQKSEGFLEGDIYQTEDGMRVKVYSTHSTTALGKKFRVVMAFRQKKTGDWFGKTAEFNADDLTLVEKQNPDWKYYDMLGLSTESVTT